MADKGNYLYNSEFDRSVESVRHIRNALEQSNVALCADKDVAIRTLTESTERLKQHIDRLQQKLLDDIQYKFNLESSLINQKIQSGESLLSTATECSSDVQSSKTYAAQQSLQQYIADNRTLCQLNMNLTVNTALEQNVLQCYSLGDAVVTRSNIPLIHETFPEPSAPLDPDVEPPPYSEVAHIHYPTDLSYPDAARPSSFRRSTDTSGHNDFQNETKNAHQSLSHSQEYVRNSRRNQPRRLTPLMSFNVRVTNEIELNNFSGVAFLSNENIAIIDKSNRKLKLYDVSTSSVTDTCLEHKPYDVAQAPDGMIAVSLSKRGEVHLFPTNLQPPTSQHTVQVDGCRGLASNADYLFVGFEHNDNTGITVLSRDHHFFRLIKCSPDGPLSVSPSGEFIYYKYFRVGKDKIVCINETGEVFWKTKVKSWLDNPSGIAAVESGLIVTVLDKIMFLSSCGQNWSDLCHFESAGAIDVNKSGTKLVITNSQLLSKNESGVVRVFNIEY